MAIKPSLFKRDFGGALDAFDKADKKAVALKGGDKKEFAAAVRAGLPRQPLTEKALHSWEDF
jgi:hypothetical protein